MKIGKNLNKITHWIESSEDSTNFNLKPQWNNYFHLLETFGEGEKVLTEVSCLKNDINNWMHILIPSLFPTQLIDEFKSILLWSIFFPEVLRAHHGQGVLPYIGHPGTVQYMPLFRVWFSGHLVRNRAYIQSCM